jgi:hypothetical protein
MSAGVADLRQAKAGLQLDMRSGSFREDPRARAALSAAAAEFGAARSNLQLWSPVLLHLGWVPRVGPELAAAPPAADAAWYATQSALHLASGLTALDTALRHHGNRHDLLGQMGSVLERNHTGFADAAADADRLTAVLRDFPSTTGNSSLTSAVSELRHAAPLLTGTSHWLAVAPGALGFGRPMQYLVLLQNPANLAPTGGMYGALEYLTLSHASVHEQFSSVALPYQITTVSAPLPEELYSPIGYWTLLDSNWSPDFPLSARIARWFYGEDTGRWSDGVIGILDPGIVRILGGTGPVYLPQYSRWVSAGNVEQLSEYYVRHTANHGPLQTGTKDTIRKQFLGYVIRALMNRLQSLPSGRWGPVSRALQAAVATREIQLYSRNPEVQLAIRTSGADGSLAARPGDFLSVVDFNESDSKLNPYVQESAQYRVHVRPDLWLDATLSLHYHVSPSPDTIEGTGPEFGFGGSKHDYEDYLRVYVPRGSQLLTVTGAQGWAAVPAYGLTQLGGRFIVREGQSRTVTFRYRVPANAFQGVGYGRYLLSVRHQPGANLTAMRVAVSGGSGVTLGQAGSTSLQRSLALDRDAALSLSLHGAIHPRLITLPRASGPVDPYIPFADLRDRRHPL